MAVDQIVFAGVDVASGRKPVTLAVLDEDLKILTLQRCTFTQCTSSLSEHETIYLSINSSRQAVAEFRKTISQAGFKQLSAQSSRRWMETDAQQDFLALCRQDLLSRRSIEGRIQRALLLHEARLRIPDPMDYFEEITRYRLMQGILPLENVYPARELDALMAAYVAWMYVNNSNRAQVVGNQVLLDKVMEETSV